MTMRRTEQPTKTGAKGDWWKEGTGVGERGTAWHRLLLMNIDLALAGAAVRCASRNRNRNLNWLIKTSKKRVARQLNKRPGDVLFVEPERFLPCPQAAAAAAA